MRKEEGVSKHRGSGRAGFIMPSQELPTRGRVLAPSRQAIPLGLDLGRTDSQCHGRPATRRGARLSGLSEVSNYESQRGWWTGESGRLDNRGKERGPEARKDLRVAAALFDVRGVLSTMFGVPCPFPAPQGRCDRQLRDMLKAKIEGLCARKLSG